MGFVGSARAAPINADEQEAARTKVGLLDPKALALQAHERRPSAEYLNDFAATSEAKRNALRYVHQVRSRIARIMDRGRCRTERRPDPSAVQGALKAMRYSGLPLRNCNHALRANKGFGRWLWKDGRSREDAIAHLVQFNLKTDRRHDRRTLGP